MSILYQKLLDCLADKKRFNPQSIGLNMNLPLQYRVENPGQKKFTEFLLGGSRPSDPVLFLPYMPGCINACIFNGRQDIVSAPFSGCHFVLFSYRGCFMSAIYGNGKANSFCTHYGSGCETACPYHQNTYAAHVAYEADETNSCKKLWEKLKTDSNCEVYIDFDPFTPAAEKAYMNNQICTPPSDLEDCTNIYGVITCDRKCFNFAMKNNGEICFIGL